MANLTEVQELLAPLLASSLFAPAENKSFVEAAEDWQVLDLLAKLLEKELAALRLKLLDAVGSSNTVDEKGHRTLNVDEAKLTQQLRVASAPDHEKMLALVEAKSIAKELVFDEVRVLNFNPSKVDFLIDTGKLSKTDLEKITPVTTVLMVKKDKKWKDVFDPESASTKQKKAKLPRVAE